MGWIESLLLGIVQGLTEFLPVSSSGHLIIGQELLGVDTSAADSLMFTVVVHAATVCSTLVVLWKEVAHLFRGTFMVKAATICIKTRFTCFAFQYFYYISHENTPAVIKKNV